MKQKIAIALFVAFIVNASLCLAQGAWDKHYYMMNKGDSRELPARKGLSYISADETIVAVNANKITAKDDGKIYIYGSLDYSNVCCSPYYISLMTPGLRHWESHGQCRIRDDEF